MSGIKVMTKVDPEQPDGESAANISGSSERHARNLRDRAVAEAKHFVVLFLYLWVLFGLFILNERIILGQRGINVSMHGVALLKGKSNAERAKAIIGIAHPKFRAELSEEAKRLGYL